MGNQKIMLTKLSGRIVSATLSFALLAAVSPVASRNSPSSKLEGMNYDKARGVIISYGWQPFHGECNGVSNDICRKYPEIETCQGVAPGYCAMSFEMKGKCLSVLTLEAPPGSDDDTFVKSLDFHARCIRDSQKDR